MLTAAGDFDSVYFAARRPLVVARSASRWAPWTCSTSPLIGPDGIADLEAGGQTGSFITLAGVENSGKVYGTTAGIHDIPDPATFAAAYKAAFDSRPGCLQRAGLCLRPAPHRSR